jgi:hypothetical protein
LVSDRNGIEFASQDSVSLDFLDSRGSVTVMTMTWRCTMTKATQIRAALAMGLSLSTLASAAAQPQAERKAEPAPAELPALVETMAERVRALAEDAGSTLGSSSSGQVLIRDTQELSQALGEYQASLATTRDRYALRRAYSGIDGSWHHLQAQLSRSAAQTPVLTQDAARVSESDARIHQALGLNGYPTNYFGGGPAPVGLAETQRLTHALVDRAEALAEAIRVEVPGPAGQLPYDAAVTLVRSADAFHDGIDLNARIDVAQNGYAGIAADSRRLAQILAGIPLGPRVRDAWAAYRSAEVLLHRNLGLPVQADPLAGSTAVAGSEPQVVPLANQLVAQVDVFLQAFRPNAGNVPEGAQFLADAERLLAAASAFRKDAARGLNPGELAFEFRDVDASWQRLARRTNRIARGRTGPQIQQVETMGQTCASLHQVLGLPGYPAAVGPFAAPR